MKICSKCNARKPISEFGVAKGRVYNAKSACKVCVNLDAKQRRNANLEQFRQREKIWHAQNPDRRRATDLLRRYKLTIDQYNAMRIAQDNSCAICKRTTARLCVDHNHKCCQDSKTCGNCIRDLLCDWCNLLIGCVEKDMTFATGLHSAPVLNYITKWRIA